MSGFEFDFQQYVEQQKNPSSAPSGGGPTAQGQDGFADYAFSGDIRVLRRLERLAPVRVVAEATVRFWRSIQRNELLGKSVKITRKQFPELYDATAACAAELGIAMPSVYVQSSPTINAQTYGTNDEAFIILNSQLVDLFDADELRFVIGHECGHLQNNHVVYKTAASFLSQGVGAYVKWAVIPASLALNSWSRRGEITCDRAGLVCCKSETAAINAMLKLAVGSRELFRQIDVDEYMRQLDGLGEGAGRFSELLSTHPYLPKRVQAIRLFAQSHHYRAMIGERGGSPLDEVDTEVERIIKVL